MELRKGQSHPLFYVLWQGEPQFPGGCPYQCLFVVNNGTSSTWSDFPRIKYRFSTLFVGVAVMCLGVSYAFPVLLSVLNHRREVLDAPYSLGRWGYFINCIAVLWVFFEMVLFSMPAVIPVTSTSMSECDIEQFFMNF